MNLINELNKAADYADEFSHNSEVILLSEAIDIARKATEWIRVSDELPKINHSVWMYKRDYQYHHTNGHCLGAFDGENWLYMGMPIVEPTHWKYINDPVVL